MANLTPAQQSVVQAMMGSFGSPSSLTDTRPMPSGPLRYDTSGGMTAPTGPTMGSNPVISEPGSYDGLRAQHVMYYPGVGEARNPDPFSYMDRLQPSPWGTATMQGGVTDVSGIGTPGMNQGTGVLEAWKRPPAQNPAVAAIGAASSQIPLPRRRPDVLPTEIMRRAAVQGFNPNAILARSQDPATRAMQSSIPGTGGPMQGRRQGMSLAPNGMKVPAVAAARNLGMSPADAYAAVNAAAAQRAALAAGRPTMNAFQRSQARQAQQEATASALNNFSG